MQQLVLDKYSYKFTRAVKIKENENRTYQITILNSSDKIVQKAFVRVLSKIFEGYLH
jgi:retron-type reverse transcriptase